jgi:hypothetical protein
VETLCCDETAAFIRMRRPPLSRFRAAAVIAAVTLGVGLSGCGALPPQAPLAYAKKLDSATSGISTACGKAYRVTAFPGDHAHDLKLLEATATSDAHKLEKVFNRNRKWVYQGFTVAEIASDAVSMLSSCGLHQAAAQLKRATTAAT